MSFVNYECEGKNPKEECPPMKITPVPVDHSIDVSSFISVLHLMNL